jgi:1-acyl-sn-glycerol-3-phosphate acyltransferase
MFYRFAWFVCRAILLIFRRMEVLGLENVPLRGGLVLASNHKSYWDPVIVGCALPRTRQVFFMAKAELFDIPLLGLIITNLGAFPVRRGGADRSAIRTALNHLSAGEVVGIFPEGTRNKSEGMLEPHLGAAMLATRANVPVLPVAVLGSRGFFGKVKIIFGPTIVFDPGDNVEKARRTSRSNLAEISEIIMDRVAGLMKS